MELKQLTTLLLGRPTIGGHTQGTGLAQGGGLFPLGNALLGLDVQQLRLGGAAANG
ncbi:hypothetical protein D9M71_171990 [compost metagenome]